MNQSSVGTATNLLRTAWDLCAADVAFLALLQPDGRLAIAATFPEYASWTSDSLYEMASIAWKDPGLQPGKVLVTRAMLDEDASGEAQCAITVATAPVVDQGISEVIEGLLCIVNPATGYFDQDQLDNLDSLASRLVAHLKAREEVFSLTATRCDGPEQPSDRLDGARVDFRHPAAEEAARQLLAIQDAYTTRDLETSRSHARPGTRATHSSHPERTYDPEDIEQMISPDELTGLIKAPSFMARLGYALGALEHTGGEVAVILLDIVAMDEATGTSPQRDALMAAAGVQLEGCLRHDDTIARVAPHTFAVLCSFKSDVDRSAMLEMRLQAALGDVLAASTLRASLRSSVAKASPEELRSPDGLFREAVAQLAEH